MRKFRMDRATYHRFAVLAGLLALFVLAGSISLPILQRCCPGPPPLWPQPPDPSLLDMLFSMDRLPRLAALAVATGTVSLIAVAAIYVVTAKAEAHERAGRSLGHFNYVRVVAVSFVVGVLYLYAFFLTGYFQSSLGWLNLLWIVGVPVLLAAFVGRDDSERRWGGPILIIPGFFAEWALMIALGIDLY